MFSIRIDVYHHQVEPPGTAARYARRLNALTARLRASSDRLRSAIDAGTEQPNRGQQRRTSTRGDFDMSTDALEQAFQNAEAAIEENDTVDGSAGALIELFASQAEANKNSPARIQALVDRMRSSSASLQAKVAANTPAADPPVDPPAA